MIDENKCPRCMRYDCLEVIQKDDGKIIYICKLCGWDSEAEEIFNEDSDDNYYF